MAPHAGQSGQGILHAGEFDLQAGFTGGCTLGKNVEYDLLAVDDADVAESFPLALLRGRQAIVDDDDVAFVGTGQLDDLSGLAGAAEELLLHLAAAREDLLLDADAQGGDQFAELLEQRLRLLKFTGVEAEAHQEGAFHHVWFLSDFEHLGAVIAPVSRASHGNCGIWGRK